MKTQAWAVRQPWSSSAANRQRLRTVVAALALVAGALILPSCKSDPISRPPATTPGPTYTGPAYFRGTVGSLAYVRNYSPMLVTGYGLVVGLDNTGSAEVPAFLRTWMIQELRRGGIGSASLLQDFPEFASMSPEQLLARRDTAVVAIQGLIPPGATAGTRFDVLVSALPQTQTTSLAGGTLWTAELSSDGQFQPTAYLKSEASAHGPIYQDPKAAREAAANGDELDFQRQAIILAGGKVSRARRIELLLNQPSYSRSRSIADRINERFPNLPGEPDTAEPLSDLVVRLHAGKRWANDPTSLVELASHVYVQRGPQFEELQAKRLANELERDPSISRRVVLAWRAMGRTIVPVLREYYRHENLEISLAALEAGASLEDERATRRLKELGDHEDPAVRKRVTVALAYLPESQRGAVTLRKLLDDPERDVRIAAYEALSDTGNRTLLHRVWVYDATGKVKFLVDMVSASRPLVYVDHRGVPRIVIYGQDLGFNVPTLARLWDNKLMMRVTAPDQKLDLFYQKGTSPQPVQLQVIPTLGWVAFTLGHTPTVERPEEGLRLSYSQVVDVVYGLIDGGHVTAEIAVRQSALAAAVEAVDQLPVDGARPEIGGAEEDGVAPVPDGSQNLPDIPGVPSEPQGGQPADPVSSGPVMERPETGG